MERWAARVSGVPRPPVDGDDLARELGVEPGPLLGNVAREVQLAWEAGEFSDADEALHLAREFLLESRSGAISTGS
jgi:poly(A) polymerase